MSILTPITGVIIRRQRQTQRLVRNGLAKQVLISGTVGCHPCG